jgi:hypothetical protein
MPENTDSDPQRQGYDAYAAGWKLDQNPHTGEDAKQWAAGWAWARTDHIKANRKAKRKQDRT